MGNEHLEVVQVINTLDEDFEYKWDGTPGIIKAGETKNFPRFLGEHVSKHMVDRMIIKGKGGIKNLRNKKLRKLYLSQVMVEDKKIEEAPEEKEIPEEKEAPKKKKLSDMTMPELRKILSKEKIKWNITDKKDELIEKIEANK